MVSAHILSHGPTAGEVQSELIRASYRAPILSPLLNMLAAAATASLFVGVVDTWAITAWLSLVFLTAGARMASLALFRRLNPLSPVPLRWGRMLVVIMGLNAAAWGSSVSFLFVPGDFQMQMNLAAFVSVTAVFVTMTTSYMPLMVAFQAVSMPPLIIMLLLEGTGEHYATAFVMSLLGVTTIVIGSARLRTVKELIHLRMELAREKETAEQANLAKSRFLAAASHDLRQPLHALGMFTAMLVERADTRDARTLARNIQGSVTALEMLLNALLDVSKLDAGSVIPRREEFALGPLLSRLGKEYAPQAAAKGLEFVTGPCTASVNSDPVLLETILRNLLSNAIRYTRKGHVAVECIGDAGDVRVAIKDTGIGIAEEHRAEVFREFRQLHNPERDRSKGLGLGLAIVDRLLRLLQHELEWSSVPDEGSCFQIKLPRSQTPPVEPAQANGPDIQRNSQGSHPPLCVLVIDDEKAILRATRALLESWGLAVLTAESAEGAMDAVGASGRFPHAIIADFTLRDGRTGLEAIASISRHLKTEIPAMIITGEIAPESLREAQKSGHPVLNKPVAPARVRAFIRQVERRLRTSETVQAP